MALVPAFLGLRRPGDRLPKPATPDAQDLGAQEACAQDLTAQDPAAPTAAEPQPAPRRAKNPPRLKSASQRVKEYLAEPEPNWLLPGFTAVPGKPGEYRYGPNADGARMVDPAVSRKARALAAAKTRDPELCSAHRWLANRFELWRVCRSPACLRAKDCSRSTTIACVYEHGKILEPHMPELHRTLKARMIARGDW